MENTFKNLPTHSESADLKFEMINDFEGIEFKEALKNLETFSGLGLQDKLMIFATSVHLKPASEIVSRSNKNETEQMLSSLHLLFQYMGEHENYSGRKYVIGSTPESLAEGVVASPGYSDHERFGKAMGLPKTAIKAFKSEIVDNEYALLQEYDYFDVLSEEQRKFMFFRLSKDHYQEELEWLDSVIEAVKILMPGLYSSIRYQI